MSALPLPLGGLDRVAAPLDLARSRVMRWALGTKLGVLLIARRDRRVAAQATVGVLVTFTLVAFAPALMLALAPIVFGVPHVASDVRYLVLRRQVTRPAIVVTIAFAALVTLLRACALAAPSALPWGGIEMALLCAWVACAGILGARASGRSERVGPVIAAACALAAFAIPDASAARLVLAHAHNVVALVVWLIVFRRSARAATLPLLLAGAAVVILLSGATLPIASARAAAFGVTLQNAAAVLAPGASAHVGLAIVLSFAFLQSVHYATWLGWIPQEDVGAEGTLSFKMSIRAIVRDFGPKGFVVVVLLSALMIGGAFVGMARTRELYLSLATFHGYLELAMLAYFLSASGAARRATA